MTTTIELTEDERVTLEAVLRKLAQPAKPAGADAATLLQRALAAREMNDAEGAVALAEEAIAAGCAGTAAHAIQASCLGDLGQHAEALAVINRALPLCTDADRDGIIHERGFQRLLSRDWGGWRDWEHRIQRRQLGDNLQRAWPGIREWDGSRGRAVLVSAEKGLGDSVLFLRYLPILFERNCTVQLLCSKASASLASLMKGCHGIYGAYAGDDAIPKLATDWIALESLPTLTNEIPASWLPVAWKPRNRDGRMLRVGLCWHGNLEYTAAQSRRPQDLRDWEPVTSLPQVEFVSLQLGEQGPCATALPPDSSLAGTLDLIRTCDLVISTDTSVVHMAASLGCPTWMPLHRLNYWPWIMSSDAATVWYPSLRIFRQRDGWGEVFQKMARELAALR
jgi:hypothetical protein